MGRQANKTQLPPFLSFSPMQGDPPCSWSDFLSPQLRRFPLVYTKIHMTTFLGHGIEGCVARVNFDDANSGFALKIVCFTLIPFGTCLTRARSSFLIRSRMRMTGGRSSARPAPSPCSRRCRPESGSRLRNRSMSPQNEQHDSIASGLSTPSRPMDVRLAISTSSQLAKRSRYPTPLPAFENATDGCASGEPTLSL